MPVKMKRLKATLAALALLVISVPTPAQQNLAPYQPSPAMQRCPDNRCRIAYKFMDMVLDDEATAPNLFVQQEDFAHLDAACEIGDGSPRLHTNPTFVKMCNDLRLHISEQSPTNQRAIAARARSLEVMESSNF